MFLRISHADRCKCQRCSSPLRQRGYVVEGSAGVRQFICLQHLSGLLDGCWQPESGTFAAYECILALLPADLASLTVERSPNSLLRAASSPASQNFIWLGTESSKEKGKPQMSRELNQLAIGALRAIGADLTQKVLKTPECQEALQRAAETIASAGTALAGKAVAVGKTACTAAVAAVADGRRTLREGSPHGLRGELLRRLPVVRLAKPGKEQPESSAESSL